jgi:hypothetical protein
VKEMDGKVIALFATLAFILVLVGSTDVVTLFGGSHQIINITSSSGTGNDIDCVPCHQWVRNELDNATYHSGMVCEDCHRYKGAGIEFAEHNQPGKEAHAAYTPRCLDCHNNNSITLANGTSVFIKKADAFGDTNYGNDYSAHKKFVKDSLNSSLSVGENEACIACHTNYSVDIEYSYFWNIYYDLNGWSDISTADFSYNVTQREYTNTFSKTGAKHEFIDTGDINCISCHNNIYDALVNGTGGGSNEDYLTHAPIEIYSGAAGDDWDEYNPWDNHYRYHYIPAANRATGVNSSYCFECHNVKKYADENPSDNTTYNLTGVTADTNSAQVHAAEALWCQTCHGSGKTKVVIDNDEQPKDGHTGISFVDDVKDNYARTFHGDICMGCHEAAVHAGRACGDCHKDETTGNPGGDATVYIESEPSGYATNN